MPKAFSLLEFIFVIIIISILASFFLNTAFFTSFDKSKYLKIKSDVALIRMSINTNYNNKILKNPFYIITLDNARLNTAKEALFVGTISEPLLKNIIFASIREKKEEAAWVKTAQNKYQVLYKKEVLEFIYNNKNGSFECMNKNTLCEALNK